MARLAIHDPGIETAAAVFARARVAFEKRRAGYLKLAAAMPSADEPLDEPDELAEQTTAIAPASRRSVIAELSRQTGIPPSQLRKGESRGQPITAIRQLGMALLIKLGHMSLPATARVFGCLNHTTVLHARRAMAPVLDACGLDESAPVPMGPRLNEADALLKESLKYQPTTLEGFRVQLLALVTTHDDMFDEETTLELPWGLVAFLRNACAFAGVPVPA